MKDFKLNDVLISILIISITLLYFLDKYFIPQGIETITIYGFEIGSFGFSNINDLLYFSKMKFLILILAIIWYLTCQHWWKHSILIIIFIELFKLISIFNPNQLKIDEIEYFSSLPLTIPIILALILLSNKLNTFNKYTQLILLIDEEINNELLKIEIKNEKNLVEIKSSFLELKAIKGVINKVEYLKELKQIRDQFYDEI